MTLSYSLFGDFARAIIRLPRPLSESLLVTKGGLNALHKEHTFLNSLLHMVPYLAIGRCVADDLPLVNPAIG